MGARQDRHYLLTSLGTSPRQTTYALDGRTAEAEHAPLALLELLAHNRGPDTVVCLTTETVRQTTYLDFADAARQFGVDVKPLDIPDGDDESEIAAAVQIVSEYIEPQSRLMLDITHGLRHIPFVFYALSIYLSSLQGVEITGAWYGKFETKNEHKPLLNLAALLRLPQWFHAVKMFQDTGAAQALAKRFEDVEKSLPGSPERGSVKAIREAMRNSSIAYEAGLPLELGLHSGKICHELEKRPLTDITGLHLPLADKLEHDIVKTSQRTRFQKHLLSDGKAKGKWKTDVPLTCAELRRQARLIDQYLSRDQVDLAMRLMREWVVSLGVLHNGVCKQWLERSARYRTERQLGAMAQEGLQATLSEQQRYWGRFWDKLCKIRNHLAHNGMSENAAEPNTSEILSYWKEIKDAETAWPPFGGGEGTLLITPVGMSPGVLYSAVRQIQPDRVVLVCSAQAEAGVNRAMREAGCPDLPVDVLRMSDPFSGFAEIKELKKSARYFCLQADEVQINLTGGTTMMGIAVQQIAEQAKADQCPVARFVLVDKRPPQEQRDRPWVESELFRVESGVGSQQ